MSTECGRINVLVNSEAGQDANLNDELREQDEMTVDLRWKTPAFYTGPIMDREKTPIPLGA